MNQILKGIRKTNPVEVYVRCLETFISINSNIIDNPTQIKYKKLNCTSKVFKENILDINGGLELLIFLGFRKNIIDFKEFFIFPESNIHLVKLIDYTTEFRDLLVQLNVTKNNLILLEQQVKVHVLHNNHREYVEHLIQTGEEERVEKLEKERESNRKLRINQNIKKEKIREAMEEQRGKLLKQSSLLK